MLQGTLTRTFAALLLFMTPAAQAQTPATIALTNEDRAEIVANSAKLLETRYVDAELGKKLARQLRSAAKNWSTINQPEQLAKQMTEWLRQTSGDGHLGISYSAKSLDEATGESGFSASEMERWYGPQINHGIEKIERFPGNIMLLDLRVFPPAGMAGDVFAAAMTVVAQGDALIIDLRRNGGGSGTAGLVTGYLLDEGQPLSGGYDRPNNKYSYSSSPVWVPGRRFGRRKPLYILTSKRTFSAAEAFAYDLQALGRATIVGEVTGGGAHPYEYRRVHRHFALDLPEGKSINPITGSNWQGVGIKPDVPVAADQALEKALELANAVLGGTDKQSAI